VAYLQSQDLSFIEDDAIVGGISKVSEVRPLVVVQTIHATAEVPFTGNWDVDFVVELRENADDTEEDDHHARAGELFSVFLANERDVADAISAAYTGFQCQFLLPKEQSFRLQDRSWISQMSFGAHCCGRDLV
jgi:hypothetical protein